LEATSRENSFDTFLTFADKQMAMAMAMAMARAAGLTVKL
jgi:hypothetical protein